MIKNFFVAIFFSILIYSCKSGKDNFLYTDATQLQQFFKEHPESKPYKKNLQLFYENRNYSCAWLDKKRLNDHAKKFIELLRNEEADSLHSAVFTKRFIDADHIVTEKKYKFKSGDSLTAAYEFLLSAAFFDYAKRSWEGISDEKLKKADWFIPRKKFDYVSILDSLLQQDANSFLTFEPVYKQYDLLKNYYEKYRSIKNNGEWRNLNSEKTSFKKGDRNQVITKIKKQLFLLNDFTNKDTSDLFDDKLETALKKFQKRHGIDQDGKISGKTAEELAVSARQRMKQLLINMERCRWLPEQFSGDAIIINIPEYKLYLYHDDKPQWNCDVVVGTDSTNTIIFSDSMEYIIFSPYWNIPKSIVIKETIPAMENDPEYLEKHDMELVDQSGEVVDVSSVSWSDYEENFPYIIRQKPGSNNSLGCVKFIFPNSHSIYLHDTPAKSLFDETDRAFSHGCVRVSEPVKLAHYLLQHEKRWTADSIKAFMYGGKETTVKLRPKIPVYITYFTAWVDNEGNLNFRDDIYHHDETMKKLLAL